MVAEQSELLRNFLDASGQRKPLGFQLELPNFAGGPAIFADVVVPNGQLLSGNLTNWTMYDRSRRVAVAYGSDPDQVMALFNAAACATPGVADNPAPVGAMTGYSGSGLNFVVRVWTPDQSSWGALRSALLARMLKAPGERRDFNSL